MRVTPWVHAARPGPPHTPRPFCAPCAAMTRPTTTRTSASARSVLRTDVTTTEILLFVDAAQHVPRLDYSWCPFRHSPVLCERAPGPHSHRSQRFRTLERFLSRRPRGEGRGDRRASRLSSRRAAIERARSGSGAGDGRADPGGPWQQRSLLRV